MNKYRDIIVTDLIYLWPSIAKWFYYKRQTVSFYLKDSKGRRATLYRHGKELSKGKAIFILHGLYGHPLIMVHLSLLAKKLNRGPVYSLYISYDMTNLDLHRPLIKEALDRIEADQGPSFEGIIMVGHSMGAIESAYRALVEKDKRIISVISIAGPLRTLYSSNLSESLKGTLNKINQAIKASPSFPLYQIIGNTDWCVSIFEAKAKNCHIIEGAMHFNILFHKELSSKLTEILRK